MGAIKNNDFLMAVSMYCKGIDVVDISCGGINCEYADGDEDHECESYFSKGQCDSCGSTLAGDRSKGFMNWKDETETWNSIEVELCVDCVAWHANGEVPENW